MHAFLLKACVLPTLHRRWHLGEGVVCMTMTKKSIVYAICTLKLSGHARYFALLEIKLGIAPGYPRQP